MSTRCADWFFALFVLVNAGLLVLRLAEHRKAEATAREKADAIAALGVAKYSNLPW